VTPEQEYEIGRGIFREANDAFFVFAPGDLRLVEVNPAAQKLTGLRRKQLLGLTLPELLEAPEGRDLTPLVRACQSTSHFVAGDDYALRVGAGRRPVHVSVSRIHTEPEPLGLVVVRDVSQQRAAEEALRQKHKMEAVGRLAGGVAHDFNNLLTVIQGYCDLLERCLGPEGEARAYLEAIQGAAGRAADLTRQLLTFSRRTPPAPQAVDLSALVGRTADMLRRLIGEDVALLTRLAPDLPAVLADPGQLEQVLLNLCANARDAMPDGGRLTLETFAPASGERAVGLRVTDTGRGMDRQTQARLFEPFFTTKEAGKGTGLGLASVYAIVTGAGGTIGVESIPGQGTVFTIHFPAAPAPPAPLPPPAPHPLATGRGTVLLVEDEEGVRNLTARILRDAGYTVLEADGGEAGRALAASHPGAIDLLLTDVVMPGLRGPELARLVRQERPGIGVLYMSGYSEEQLGVETAQLVSKPFTAEALTRAVRDRLASRS
jgi:PAS domain S-box-containing protein